MNNKLSELSSIWAQWLSGLAAISFVAAAIFNGWIFDGWGLNFLQIASAADVLNSGIDLFFRLLAPLIGFTSGWVLVRGLMFKFNDRVFISNLIGHIRYALIIFAMAMAIHVASGGIFSPLIFIFAFSYGYYFSYEAAIGRISHLIPAIMVIIIFIITSSLGIKSIINVSKNGFQPRRLVLNDKNYCKCDVLWIGERSVVVNCIDGNIKVIYGGEGIKLEMFESEDWPPVDRLKPINRRDISPAQQWLRQRAR